AAANRSVTDPERQTPAFAESARSDLSISLRTNAARRRPARAYPFRKCPYSLEPELFAVPVCEIRGDLHNLARELALRALGRFSCCRRGSKSSGRFTWQRLIGAPS